MVVDGQTRTGTDEHDSGTLTGTDEHDSGIEKSYTAMKKMHPSMSLPILELTHLGPSQPATIDKPYQWAVDQFLQDHPGFCSDLQPDEDSCQQFLKHALNALSKVWILHIPVGDGTNIKGFQRLFGFACDVLTYTIPKVEMSYEFWNDYSKTGQPETISRLMSTAGL